MVAARIKEALILCGGLGTRLRSVVNDRPKTMADIEGRPFMERIIVLLVKQGISHIVLCTGYKSEDIAKRIENWGSQYNVKFTISQEEKPLGTGGAIKLALPYINENNFIVVNGDTFCRFDVNELLQVHSKKNANATLLLSYVDGASRFGQVQSDEHGCITEFKEKSGVNKSAYVNTGVYLLNRECFSSYNAADSWSLEKNFFPGLIGKGLVAVKTTEQFLDIGTPASYAYASEFLKNKNYE